MWTVAETALAPPLTSNEAMKWGQRSRNSHQESTGRAQPHRPVAFPACRMRLPARLILMLAEGASFSTTQRGLRATAPTISALGYPAPEAL